MVCCLTLERPGWWSRAARWLEAAREELVWRLEPEPAVVIPMSADRAREELNRRAEELLDRHGNAILRYAYSYLHNMSDAEEVLQDTMIQFLKAAPQFDGPSHEKAWLLRVAGNLSKNRLDYNARCSTDELKEDLSFVWEAVKQLPQEQRACIHLFYYEGYPTRDVARMLGRKESTIRSDLRRGREKLKKLPKEAYDFEGTV